ncbi:hypothetical protein NDU88_002422 [Pleurodeles waltl]|uniref:Secreted protein n=1 Tax=Pleurodeles waltl TaxID=8319 RepID=A0AAV7UVL2_PLEWA|nr:hypothetical protein NDU88_002422 [Pleurodeles waltl]
MVNEDASSTLLVFTVCIAFLGHIRCGDMEEEEPQPSSRCVLREPQAAAAGHWSHWCLCGDQHKRELREPCGNLSSSGSD